MQYAIGVTAKKLILLFFNEINNYVKYYFNSTNYNNILIKEINNKKDAYVEYYYYNWNPKNLFRYFFINKEFIGKIIFHVPSDKIVTDYE